MTKKYIIVKYADDDYPGGFAPFDAAVHPDSYTAKQCGITDGFFTNKEVAKEALIKMEEVNPGVGYGVVELIGD